jgi:hypothetical protein
VLDDRRPLELEVLLEPALALPKPHAAITRHRLGLGGPLLVKASLGLEQTRAALAGR